MNRTAASPSAPATPGPALIDRLAPAGAFAVPAPLRAAALVLLGAGLLTLSAKVQVPFHPVPMTLQSMVVLLLGAVYGPRLGVAAVALYLAQGLAGLPVFAGAAAGPAYFAGPTGGFLVGFLPAAWAAGALAARARGPLALLGAMALAHGVLFAAGLGWLALAVGPAKAWALGFAPFALGTLAKTAAAALAAHALRRGAR